MSGERPTGQRLPINGEPLKAPGRKRGCREPKLEGVLQKTILHLKVLRGEEHPFCPQNRLHLTHRRHKLAAHPAKSRRWRHRARVVEASGDVQCDAPSQIFRRAA